MPARVLRYAFGMTVKRFEDLVCWQLAHALKCEVIAFTAAPPASRDFKYRDEIREASASATSNIAEAFGRFRTGDAARFCEFAVGSLDETRDRLIDGRDRGYLTDQVFSRLANLAQAARRATVGWLRYLKGPAKQRENPTESTSNQNPKGSTQNPRGSTQNTKGSTQNPKGSTQNPRASAENPRASAQNPPRAPSRKSPNRG